MIRGLFIIVCLAAAPWLCAQVQNQSYNYLQVPQFDPEDDEWDEDEFKGFSFALNIGAYFANKGSGNLYNGMCLFNVENDPNGVRCYDIMERLTLNIQDVNYITNYYNISSFEGPFDMHPIDMRYQPAFRYGLNLLYHFNEVAAVTFEFSSMQVKAIDRFTLRFVGGEIQQNAQDNTQIFDIWGEETRFNVHFGYRHSWIINDDANFFVSLGPSLLGTKLEGNKIRVADRNWDLIIGALNPQQIQAYRPRTRTGFGYFGEVGVEAWFNGKIRMDIGLNFSRDKVIIENFEDNLLNWAGFVRFGV